MALASGGGYRYLGSNQNEPNLTRKSLPMKISWLTLDVAGMLTLGYLAKIAASWYQSSKINLKDILWLLLFILLSIAIALI